MTDKQLAAIRARADQATPAPWVRGTRWGGNEGRVFPQGSLIDSIGEVVTPEMRERLGDHAPLFFGQVSNMPNYMEDAEFIAHAREDIPALLAEIGMLRAIVVALTEEVPQSADNSGGVSCTYCMAYFSVDEPHKPDCPYAMAVAYVEAMKG